MKEKMIQRLMRWRRSTIMKIVEEVLFLVSPVALIGSIASIIAVSFFTKNGFFNELFHISEWLPHFSAYQYSFKTLSTMTVGLIAVFVSYQMASVTTNHYDLNVNSSIVGLTSVSAFLILTAKYVSTPLGEATLGGTGYQNLLIAMATGYIVAMFFRIFSQNQQRFRNIIFPMSICIFIAFGVNKIFLLIQYYLKEPIMSWLLRPLNGMLHLWQSLVSGVLVSVCSWFGFIPDKLQHMGVNIDNLEAVMLHKAIPYPYDAYTLFCNYGQLMLIAFVIALVLFSRQYKSQLVGRCSLIPTLFNQNQFLYTATPLLFNFNFLPALIFIPLFNMIIGAMAIAIHLVPVSAYQGLAGIPNVFLPLVTTNGSWVAFIFGLLLVALDVWLWKPFIRLDDDVMMRLENEDAA